MYTAGNPHAGTRKPLLTRYRLVHGCPRARASGWPRGGAIGEPSRGSAQGRSERAPRARRCEGRPGERAGARGRRTRCRLARVREELAGRPRTTHMAERFRGGETWRASDRAMWTHARPATSRRSRLAREEDGASSPEGRSRVRRARGRVRSDRREHRRGETHVMNSQRRPRYIAKLLELSRRQGVQAIQGAQDAGREHARVPRSPPARDAQRGAGNHGPVRHRKDLRRFFTRSPRLDAGSARFSTTCVVVHEDECAISPVRRSRG